MIVLDTNVLSEAMRPRPDASVMAWYAARTSSEVFTTALTKAEIFYGRTLLPDGERKRNFLLAAHVMFESDFAGRVLCFDSEAAMSYAEIAARRRRLGRPISQVDGQIAAIAKACGARLATRNLRDFEDCGITLVDLWRSG